MSLPRLKSLADLKSKSKRDERYARVVKLTARDYGGRDDTLEEALSWLDQQSREMSPESVLSRANELRTLID